MRILHTSDWHLGISSGTTSRAPDHDLFLDWLLDQVEQLQVDALVIAGDVFDAMQPGAHSLAQYYRFLVRAAATGLRQVVVVGGNHDSASRLDAPAEVLAALDVHVVGGVTSIDDPADRYLVPLIARGEQEPSAVALAVPYVHEYRLGVRTTDLDHSAIRAAFADRFGALYRRLADRAQERWPGLPLVATGHLTIGPRQLGDAPREIHIVGTLEGLPTSVLERRLQYTALGHIHRPLPVLGDRAWYSGSPVALSLPEAAIGRRVLCVDLDPEPDGQPKVQPVPVPSFRGLVELQAPPDELLEQVRALQWSEPLPPLLYCRVVSDDYEPGLERRLGEVLPGDEQRGHAKIAELRGVRATPLARGEVHEPVNLSQLQPAEVFATLCQARGQPLTPELQAAFASIVGIDPAEIDIMTDAIREGRA